MAGVIDLVDKKKLIRNILRIFDKHINASAEYPAELFEIKRELLGIIEIEQSFFTQDSVNRWIPCSERLPEDNCYTLVAVLFDEIYEVYIAAFRGDGWHTVEGYVTHWMPMPELPVGGADNG